MITWRVLDDYPTLSRDAADRLLAAIESDPRAVLLLPTGTTPEGMYAEVVRQCRGRYFCFRDVTTFNLDEYVGLPADHSGSYFSYMQERLFRHTDLDPARRHIPDGTAERIRRQRPELSLDEALELECARYEEEIRRAGGIDLAILGMGRNGHIGFNEPGSPFDSRTRVVELHPSTRQANAPFFPDGDVPSRAITAGIATILSAARIILLVSGASKADAVRRLASTEPSPDLPASALLNHSDVLVLADREAAAKIEQPQGMERPAAEQPPY